MTTVLATAIPENSNDGYVAAAYIVFFAILLIYVAVMAIRLSHVERDLRDLQARGEQPAHDGSQRNELRQDEPRQDEPRQDSAHHDGGSQDPTRQYGTQPGETGQTPGQARERETV